MDPSTRHVLAELTSNKVFLITVYSWAITQTIKVFLGVIREKRFDFRWFIGTGGMPSSHAATVSALTTAVGLYGGFETRAVPVEKKFLY